MLDSHGLTHIQLAVRDLERSIRFYRTLLGMQELRRLRDVAVMLQTPGTLEVFTLNCDASLAERAGTMGGVAHFGFKLRSPVEIESLGASIAEAGGKLVKHGVRSGDERYAELTDPDGYEIELFWHSASGPRPDQP